MLRGHEAPIYLARFSRDARYLFTASRDDTLRRWDVATGHGVVLISGGKPIRDLAVAADGRVSFLHGNAMKLIAPDGAIRTLGSGAPWIGWVEFDRVKDRMLLHRMNRSVAVIGGDRVIELPANNYGAKRFAVSPDGARIAAAIGDRTIRIWDAATGRVLDVLRGHSDLVLDLAFSPDGTLLATSSHDRTVRIWSRGGRQVRVLRGHAAAVGQLEWTRPDRLVTGSSDGTLRVWDVPPVELPAAAELASQLSRATTAKIDVDRPTTGAPRPRRI